MNRWLILIPVLAFILGAVVAWNLKECPQPPQVVPVDTSAITADLEAAHARVDSLQAILDLPSIPVQTRVNDRTHRFTGAPVDSLFGVLDSVPRTDR